MEKDRSLTLQPEFTLPHGEELKKMARIGLAHAKAQQEAKEREDAVERILQAARDAAHSRPRLNAASAK